MQAYALIGNILSQHLNTTFQQYLKEEILEPMGMNDSGYIITESLMQEVRLPYSCYLPVFRLSSPLRLSSFVRTHSWSFRPPSPALGIVDYT